jgi:two-component system sensor kinase FixL
MAARGAAERVYNSIMLEPNRPSSELQALLDAAVDTVILINSRGRIEIFNRAAERLFGYAALEVIGQNVSILMTDDDRTQHDAYMERYQRTGMPHIIGIGREVIGRRKDGTSFPAFLSVGRIAETDPPRYVGFIQDLTLRQQALAAVVRERDRANGYLEAAQTILVALDRSRRITLINRKGCEILGCEESELLGLNWFETVVAYEERAAAAGQFAQFIGDEPHRPYYSEYRVRASGGASRLIAWRYVVVAEPAGGISGILCSGDDVTDVRIAEEEAREARERMMHVSRLATMGEMTTGIAHELNQPLAAITTYAQAAIRLLKTSPPGLDDVGEALEQIAAQGLRAGEIIRRLRSLVRNRETQREPTHINDLIEELGTLTRADARLNDVRIALDLAADLPRMQLDRIQIQQVLLNLVGNALQALESTSLADREIVISTGLGADGDVELRVRDMGPGVSNDMLGKLFQPFATTKADGTGLGLAISRSIIEAHKGKLEYRPNVPQGACFVVRLPALKEAGV